MRKLTLLAVLTFLLPGLRAADQVTLINGDVLNGTILKKDGDKLTIKSAFLGNVTVPWSAIQTLRSDGPLTVVLPGGKEAYGPVSTAGTALVVTTASGTRTEPFSAVKALRNAEEQRAWEILQHPRLVELWTGTVDLGLALARGNARTDTLTTAATASRATSKDKVTLHFNQIYGTARVNNVTSATASVVRGGWTYSRNLDDRLFVTTLNDYEHDAFQDLDLRFLVGGGAGVNAIQNPRTSLSFNAGFDYDRDRFISGVDRDSAEGNFGNSFSYKLSAATQVTESFHFFSNISEAGQYRVSFDANAVTAIRKWLGWHVTASDRFLSNPLPGTQRNDILLSTGFRLNFATQK